MANFNCTFCNKVFTRRDNLHRHVKTHGVEATVAITNPTVPPPTPTIITNPTPLPQRWSPPPQPTPSEKFNCTICDKSYTTKRNLKRHLVQDHDHVISKQSLQPPLLHPPKPFHIWSKPEVVIRNYYRHNGVYYICPSCLIAHESFDEFVAAHSQHAGQFFERKADTFASCTVIKAEDDQVSSSRSYSEVDNDDDDDVEFYIWNDLDAARQYYKHCQQFLCPKCDTHTVKFEDFVEHHRHHAKAFLRPKSTYSKPPPLRSINRSTQQQQQHLSETAMKRQHGGAMERIRVSHRTGLRNCHVTIDVFVFDNNATSARHFIDDIVIVLCWSLTDV